MPNPAADILRVFADSSGKFGDRASVVVDEGGNITEDERRIMARRLKTGETAFINEIASAKISIVHPQGEIGFAGVAALATAWLLGKIRGAPIEAMHTRDGKIVTWQEGELTWVRASLNVMPSWHHQQVATREEVEHLTVDGMRGIEHTMVWTWVDEPKGLIRARTFASDWDIPEAEGNGSGSMLLATMLHRKLEIMHGRGSIVFAKPVGGSHADVGGRVVEL